jgi:hypothetical protein
MAFLLRLQPVRVSVVDGPPPRTMTVGVRVGHALKFSFKPAFGQSIFSSLPLPDRVM